jgi:hypothetical protein
MNDMKTTLLLAAATVALFTVVTTASAAEPLLSPKAKEEAGGLEARAAALLPGLFLARIDGMSPVEYVTAEADRNAVRRVAIPLIAEPPARLAAVRDAWAADLRARMRGPELGH